MTDFTINNNHEKKYNDLLNIISKNNLKPNYDSINFIVSKLPSQTEKFDLKYLNTVIDNLYYDIKLEIDLFKKDDYSKNTYKYKIYTIQTMYEFGGVVTISLLKNNLLYKEYQLLSNNNSINFIIIDDDDITHLY